MKKMIIYAILLMALFALPVQGVEAKPLMAQTRTIPLREYTPGTYEIELNTLPGNSEGAEIYFSRPVDMPVGQLAQIDVYMSRDNGATWGHVMGSQLSGGIIYNKDGTVAQFSKMLFTWPGEAGPNGRVMLKGSDVKVIAVVFQTFSTEVTLNSITSTGK